MISRYEIATSDGDYPYPQPVLPSHVHTPIRCARFFQSFDSVRKAIATLRDATASTGIDVLCCNAGVMALADVATKDGYDVQMQVRTPELFD